MTMTDDDRAHLIDRARARLTRRTVAMAVVVIVVVPLSLLVGLALGWHRHPRHRHDMSIVVVIAVTIAICVFFGLFTWWLLKHAARRVSMVAGADWATRGAVRRALRDGSTADARTDLLVRDQADRWRSQRRAMWIFPVGAVVESINAVVTRHEPERLLAIVLVALMLISGFSFLLADRRIRHYGGLRPDLPVEPRVENGSGEA